MVTRCAAVADVLVLLNLPEWPSAAVLLLRFVSALGGTKGLGSPEASVRQISMDFLAIVAARLCADADADASDANEEWLAGVADSSRDAGEAPEPRSWHRTALFLSVAKHFIGA
jgi:hypothetical protein